MSTTSPGPGSSAVPPPAHGNIRFSPWNLLLLLPLLILFTPIFNRVEPRLFGIPFFYWFQLAFIAVGVTATSLVFLATRGERPVKTVPAAGDVDDLDEGAGAR